jgi:hypothetical protein
VKRLLPVPNKPSHIDRFEMIRDGKRDLATKAAIKGEEVAIRLRFAAYRTLLAANALHNLPDSTLTAMEKELRSCYSPAKGINAIKENIVSAQPKGTLIWCPYCGATSPGGYDHYVPAKKFPEFAALAVNLVPICSRCNSTKDDDWLLAGSRQYLHFYRDRIPNVPFLTVTLGSVTAAKAISARFELHRAGMEDDAWELLESHFRKLNLIRLYNTKSNDLVSVVLRSARSYVGAGGTDVAAFLANEASESATLYGRYGWRSVLYKGISEHPQLPVWMSWL